MAIDKPATRVLLGVTLLGAASALVYAGYRLGEPGVVKLEHDASLVSLKEELAEDRQRITELDAQIQIHLDALAIRLGRLQAQVVRLDALGERMVSRAQLDGGEFNFTEAPAIGGPEETSEGNSLKLPEFERLLDELSAQLDDRARQLDIMEELLLNHDVKQAALPAGKPVDSGWISSSYGKRLHPTSGKMHFHRGMDFAGKPGSDVLAVADGVVTWVGRKTGYGKMVEINHADGYATRYAHNQENFVKVGDRVHRGDVIAALGSTGRTTGPHVHFEVIRDGKTVNPAKYVRAGP
ncbi:MAG: peptidoglycan DD-metalloendopeptidase family protein [Chromatiales bacterium]|nr:peptidoglycan DD-metalloendopeptidase family protein [Chromatiales bacterium]